MPVSPRDPDVVNQINDLIQKVGGSPDKSSGRFVRQAIQSALSFARPYFDNGERKLVANSLRELRYALKTFSGYRDARKISIFGSARTPEDHPDYIIARDFGKLIANEGWMVITGAGDGIMKAGHEGAGRENSFGVSIMLPFETNSNTVIEGDEKLVTFRYFFTRKLLFVWKAHALGLLPGGFGTLDEALEVLTLIQTGKSPLIPLVMLAPKGNDYWVRFDEFVKSDLLANQLISPEDLNLYRIFDDPSAAAKHVAAFYHNYHSMRFVRDHLVLRLLRPLSDDAIVTLNDEFADILVDGEIHSTEALDGEYANLELPRITFHFNRRSYGKLRRLIDRVNELSP